MGVSNDFFFVILAFCRNSKTLHYFYSKTLHYFYNMTNFFENSRTPLCVHKGLEKVVRFKEKTLYEFFHKKCDLNIRWFMKSIYEVLSDQKLSWKSWSRKLYRKNDTFCTMAAMSCFFFTFVCF